jgi:hypothetical protein
VSTTYILTVFIGGGGALAALAVLYGREWAGPNLILQRGVRFALWLGTAQFVLGVLLLALPIFH